MSLFHETLSRMRERVVIAEVLGDPMREACARHERRCRWVHAFGVPEQDVEALEAPRITDAVKAAREFRASGKRMLVLAGPVGVGKTVAACDFLVQGPPGPYRFGALAVGQDPRDGQRWPADRHPRFISAARFALMDMYKPEVTGPYERCSVLVLDDLGMEVLGDNVAGKLDVLIDARYRSLVWTVITTNLPVADFRKRYGTRIVDRIREVGEYVELQGESLRRRT